MWKKFPGRRGLVGADWAWKHRVRFALLVDDPTLLDTEEGRASLSAMSPEQLDKAWQITRDRIIPVTDVIFPSVECTALISSGDVDICETDNGVGFDAIVNGGLNGHLCWECGHDVLTDNWWSPRGLAEPGAREMGTDQPVLRMGPASGNRGQPGPLPALRAYEPKVRSLPRSP